MAIISKKEQVYFFSLIYMLLLPFLPFCLVSTSRTVLNLKLENEYPYLIPQIRGKSITIKCNDGCWFCVDGI